MAFLSDATHRGLVGKHQPVLGTEYGGSERGHHHHEEEMVTPDEAGIQCTGEFVGGIRCMEVHRTPGSSIDSMRVWTGEQDGALCVRDGQGRGRFTVEKKRKVFVTALMCHGWDNTPGRFMYAGMSDGYLRVYDQVTLPDGNTDYEMICEHKKHTAAVTCMLSVRDLVITGGRDWQIFTWRWEGKPGAGGVFRAMDQLWGHQNAVRCLTYDQGPDRLLYSGGDDCSIKCIELETGRSRSVPGGFPIEGAPATRHGHRGGVRSLVVYERYLFSASEDGSVKVWDSQDGSFVNTMYKAAYSDAAVLALLKDPAGGRIWAGGADGIIRVFSAYDHILVCHMEDPHNGSMVTGLMSQGRVNAIKAWFLSREEGVIRLLYSESDTSEGPPSFYTSQEMEMADEVGALRTETIEGCRELEAQKKLHDYVSGLADKRRDKALGHIKEAHTEFIKKKFFQRLLQWHFNNHQDRRRRYICHVLATNSTRFMTLIYWKKLARWGREQAEQSRRRCVSRALLVHTQKGLQIFYYRKLCEWVRKESLRAHRLNISDCLGACTTKGLMSIYYRRFMRAGVDALQRKKRLQICGALSDGFGNSLLARYYFTLSVYSRYMKRKRQMNKVAREMRKLHNMFLRRIYLAKCINWLRQSKRHGKVRAVVAAESGNKAVLQRRYYWWKLRGFCAQQKYNALDARIEELDELIDELSRRLAEGSKMTYEEIDEEMENLHDEMNTIKAEMGELEDDIHDAEMERRKLESELRNMGREEFKVDTGAGHKFPTSQAAVKLIGYMKKHGVNCKEDQKTIDKLDEDKEKKGVKPETIFVNGVKRVREALQMTCDQNGLTCNLAQKGGDWDLPDETLDKMTKRNFEHAHNGIKMIVIAADQTRDPKIGEDALAKLEKSPFTKQVLKNQMLLIDMVIIVWENRMRKQLYKLGRAGIEELGLQEAVFGSVKVAEMDFPSDGHGVGGPDDDDLREHETGTPRLAREASLRRSGSAAKKAKPKAVAGFKLANDLKITELTPDGPADRAGLKLNDVLTQVGRVKVSDKKSYGAAMKAQKSGEPVQMTYKRSGRQKSAAVMLAEL